MSLTQKLNDLCGLFQEVKKEVRERDEFLYEQWEAGGFIVDTNVLSMYPNIEEVVEQLGDEDHDEEEEEMDEVDEAEDIDPNPGPDPNDELN